MFKRNALDWLNEWKHKEDRKPLVIRITKVEKWGMRFELCRKRCCWNWYIRQRKRVCRYIPICARNRN